MGVQPRMERRYDLVVLGGGTAGLIASLYAARVGARVALVEQAEQPGGDCLFTGCVPSKSLLASAQRAHDMRTADELGLAAVEPSFDFARVMEADARALSYRAAIIATGSRPAVPPIPGLADADFLTNETVWDLRELPPRLTVLGGGPTGCELGQAFARLGTRVEIVEAAPVLLPGEDSEAGSFIANILAGEGVAVQLEAPVTQADPAPEGGGALVAGGRRVEYDSLLVAVGRAPANGGIGLENVGVELDERGFVKVDARLRTTGDRIWAAGDAVGRMYFTHVAGHQGLTAMANALFRARRSFAYSAVPRVTFTDPEVA